MAELDVTKCTVDLAEQQMLKRAQAEGIETIWDRADKMKPCPIGSEGACCRICSQGPCRVPPPKKAKEGEVQKKQAVGLCGATAETIVARNFARMVAGGSAAHTDHARGVAHLFKEVAHGRAPGYELKDVAKLRAVARDYDVPLTVGEGDDKKPRSKEEIAQELADKVLAEFGQQTGELVFPSKRAPKKRVERWRQLDVMPRGFDREVVEIMHRTHMGVDQDYKNILHQCTRCAISDGWGGSMLATELQDVLFGCPVPVLGDSNLGVLKEDHVNIIIHGHEPLLPELISAASQDPEMLEYAKSKGAKGIQLAGICCSANEILMRHGIPVAANFLGQELAVITGAVDAMVVDVQCQFQALAPLVKCFHTKLITTDERGRIEGETMFIPFDDHHGPEIARKVLKEAIDNFPNRRAPVIIPEQKYPCVVGFSMETIRYLLGGSIRGSYYTLNDNIIGGRVRGVGGVVGCNNVRTLHDNAHLTMVKELIKNDVVVLTTGCNAIACAKEGLLTPEAAIKYCGAGLAEVCETVGIPPVLHMGSCVDNARILLAAAACVKAGGLGSDISDLPAAGAAPEWMSEKAISIGHYFVSSGVYTVFGVTFPSTGSEILTDYLFKGLEEELGGMWDFELDPVVAAQKMIAHIDKKRAALGIDKARERVLYDMAMRRDMEEAALAEEA